jgi:hypothetical protein
MKKILMLLLNIFGIACFIVGLLKLVSIESTYDWHLYLWWIMYLIIPLAVIGIDLKYIDKVFDNDLYLKK